MREKANKAALAFAEGATRVLPLPKPGVRSGLDAPLIMSLTSYPPRYRSLEPTLRRLMGQTVRPDLLILWVAEADFDQLPSRILSLAGSRLSIRLCADEGPFKKFLSAVEAYPDTFLVTVDDDVPYRRTMLAELVEAYQRGAPSVIAHRARRLTRRDDTLAPYARWPMISEGNAEGDDIVPTGVGGVLYPPGSLRPEALDRSTFRRLTPTADDLWLLWMTRRAGFTSRMVARPREPGSWNGTQEVGLWRTVNVEGESRNDTSLRAMWANFGPPERQSDVLV